MAQTRRTRKPPKTAFRQRLRTELPRLLREDLTLRQELDEILRETFPSRAELAEIRALREDFQKFTEVVVQRFEAVDRRFETMDRRFVELREDMDRRFEAMDRRFQVMDQRFEAVLRQLRTQQLHLSRLSGRLGYGLEYIVREVVEEFTGKAFARSERLVLNDRDGEVFGVPAEIEFDLFASNGEAYLCEVKSHVEPDDVLQFHRKSEFAAKHIPKPFTRVIIAASMEAKAEKLMKSLGIKAIVRVRLEDEPAI